MYVDSFVNIFWVQAILHTSLENNQTYTEIIENVIRITLNCQSAHTSSTHQSVSLSFKCTIFAEFSLPLFRNQVVFVSGSQRL